jgi:hypothetical protein
MSSLASLIRWLRPLIYGTSKAARAHILALSRGMSPHSRMRIKVRPVRFRVTRFSDLAAGSLIQLRLYQ